jgi:hypothetical protein
MTTQCEFPSIAHYQRINHTGKLQSNLKQKWVLWPIVEPHECFKRRQGPPTIDTGPGSVFGDELIDS